MKVEFKFNLGEKVTYTAQGVVGVVAGLCVYQDGGLGVCVEHVAEGRVVSIWVYEQLLQINGSVA